MPAALSATDLLRVAHFGKEAAGVYDYTLKHVNPFDQNSWLNTTRVGNIASYVTPGLGTVTAGRDLYNNVRAGNVLGSLGSAGMMALGLVPGAGMLGVAGKGLGAAGKMLRTSQGLRAAAKTAPGMMGTAANVGAQGTRALAKGMTAAGNTAHNVNNAMAAGVQKIVPQVPTQWKGYVPMTPMSSARNAIVRNPVNVIGMTQSTPMSHFQQQQQLQQSHDQRMKEYMQRPVKYR